ncbi:MAG: SIS domain-containing protein [Patescibacteria group bacterium]|nr:SIS domain-containing protein [Patescibacteria group bacterium]MDD5715962.1 SIS domain-containing protein [Patescibacteria group bacterium]
MNLLDSTSQYRRYDKSNLLQSIESLGLQCRQAWEEANMVKIPRTYRQVKNILINGMGGSALGGHIIESLFGTALKVPIKIINHYSLPGFVDRTTLYIISSYSGTTEEPLSTFAEARRRKAKLMVICMANSKLARLAQKYRVPGYFFVPQFNPCNQPRMGLGYSVIGQIVLLRRSGLLKLAEGEFKEAVQKIVALHRRFGAKVPLRKNGAKQTARAFAGRIPIIVGADHLSGNAHVFANQINENSKVFSSYFLIPELNHHLMEGLKLPRANRSVLKFLFIESRLYLPKIQRRFAITKKVLLKNKISFASYIAAGRTPIEQVLEILLFGSYMNYYLALSNRLNPTPVPYVDFFKEQLAK